MKQILQQLFRRHFGREAERVVAMASHGSGRHLSRLIAGENSAIGAVYDDVRENQAFLGFSRHFRRCGLSVPDIYAEAPDGRAYLEEDLGDQTLFSLLSEKRAGENLEASVIDIYHRVVEELPRFQILGGRRLNYRLCYPRAHFDKQSMLWDLNHFKYYFLRLARIPFHEQELEDDFEKFSRYLLAARRTYFLYRDFQSRNVMVRDGEPWFIDYQGGRKGALPYDIASLLYDAKADLPFPLRAELLQHYLKAAASLVPLDPAEFLKFYPGYVLIRIMQAMGTYGLRGFHEKKTLFLQSIPYAIRNLEYLLGTATLPVELPALMSVFRHLAASSRLRQYGQADLKLAVRITSFSYKNGIPADERGHGGGYVFDCRALPNPGRFEQYAPFTGQDEPVIAFLEKEAAVHQFLECVFGLIDAAVDNYQTRNFTNLDVAFGCTGGRHRSVYCAEQLAGYLRRKYSIEVILRHREQEIGEA